MAKLSKKDQKKLDKYGKQLKKITKERNKVLRKLHKAERKGKEKIQDKCNHRWVDDGHDSHYGYERCTNCDKSRRV
jgi:hypothetical protein